MRRMAVWVFLLALMAAESAVAAVTSPGGARVVPEEEVDQLKRLSVPGQRRGEILEQVTPDHWAYQEIVELQEKYGPEKKLSEGKPCSRGELVEIFISILRKVVEKYDKEGSQGISRDDLDSLRALIVSLDSELWKKDVYRTLRRTIEQLLVLIEPPGLPSYKYKYGVNGFLRGEGARNFKLTDLSYAPNQDSGRFLYRVKPYAYWRPTDYLDIGLEGQGYGFTGEESGDSYKFSLYQGFVEGRIPQKYMPGRNWVALKMGRQEFNYGTAFILGSNTFFEGLSYDGARLRVNPGLPRFAFVTLDLLGGQYAYPFSGGRKGDLIGAYLTYEPAEDSTLEAYAFRDTGSEDPHPGEHLDILGFRSTSKVGIFALEVEGVYETGKLFNPTIGGNENIYAFGGHVDLTGQFKVGKYNNAVFLSYALGSGDKNAVNGLSSAGEFRNPNNNSSLVGDMNLVKNFSGITVGNERASGLQVYTLGWGIDIPVGTTSKRLLNFTATGRKFVANEVKPGFSRDVGIETDFALTFTLNKDYSFILGYDHFFTGGFFRDATGSSRDIDYAFLMFIFNYDRIKRAWMRIY